MAASCLAMVPRSLVQRRSGGMGVESKSTRTSVIFMVARAGCELVQHVFGILALAAVLGSAGRCHAAVDLVARATPYDRLARALLGAGQEAADHDGVGAGGQCLDDIPRRADAAIGDHGDA